MILAVQLVYCFSVPEWDILHLVRTERAEDQRWYMANEGYLDRV